MPTATQSYNWAHTDACIACPRAPSEALLSTPYVSLADFAHTLAERSDTLPAYAHPEGPPIHLGEELGLRYRLDDLLDTMVALQRAEWLHDSVYLGPRSMSEVYGELLQCCRTLGIPVPPAVIGPIPGRSQGTFGTDARAYVRLSSFYMSAASSDQRRFILGRLAGHIHCEQVTWGTMYALLVDHNGVRRLARRAIGPALEFILAPLSVGARLALSRWHRAAELTADRAGLLCAGSLAAAGESLLRLSLGVRPNVTPEEYMEQQRSQRPDTSPGRFAEVLSSQPWTHKRMKALELFTRSQTWVDAGHEPLGDVISKDELDAQTSKLLGVG